METILLDGQNAQDIRRAGEILQKGGLVAIPTETVYGLAGNALCAFWWIYTCLGLGIFTGLFFV